MSNSAEFLKFVLQSPSVQLQMRILLIQNRLGLRGWAETVKRGSSEPIQEDSRCSQNRPRMIFIATFGLCEPLSFELTLCRCQTATDELNEI